MEESKYLECIVRPEQTAAQSRKPLLWFVGAALWFVISLFVAWIALLPMVVCLVLGILAKRKSHPEYEYTLMDSDFAVDIIYNGTRRKRILELALKSAAAFAPLGDDELGTYERQGMKTVDYSSGREGENHWVLVTKEGKVCTGYILTLSEEMQKEIRRRLRMEGIYVKVGY